MSKLISKYYSRGNTGESILSDSEENFGFDIIDELAFNHETLNDELQLHSQKVAIISHTYEKLAHELSKMEILHEANIAAEWNRVKMEETDVYGKPLSDTRVTNVVQASKPLLAEKLRIASLKARVNTLKKFIKMFDDRSQHMMEYARSLRKTV